MTMIILTLAVLCNTLGFIIWGRRIDALEHQVRELRARSAAPDRRVWGESL